jgi:hypothetical protein
LLSIHLRTDRFRVQPHLLCFCCEIPFLGFFVFVLGTGESPVFSKAECILIVVGFFFFFFFVSIGNRISRDVKCS